jgi:proteasome lid subunit RPN8/RPN11
MKDLKALMLEHADSARTYEVCGLVVSDGRRYRIIRARNLARLPKKHFDLDPEAWLEVKPGEMVVGTYHSHPLGDPTPSPADIAACELSELPMHIICPGSGAYRTIQPTGQRLPYEHRPYVHGVLDCYAVVRDWYNWEWGLNLPNFHREYSWWTKGQDLYVEHFEACGFVDVGEVDLKHGDAFLIQSMSPVPNHAAIWLEGGKILHHREGAASGYEFWTHSWARRATHHLRHKTRINDG